MSWRLHFVYVQCILNVANALRLGRRRMISREHEWFVGEMGLTFEADGFTRIGGRLFGHLLLADRPLSLDEIAAALRVSKASVSTDARRLLEKASSNGAASPATGATTGTSRPISLPA